MGWRSKLGYTHGNPQADVVVGPKDLPRVLRTVGGWARKARAMAREFQGTLDDMVRESELDEIGKEVKSIAGYDVTKELENAIDPTGIETFLDEPVTPLADDKPEPVDEAASSDGAPAAEPAAAEPAVAGEAPEGEPEPVDEAVSSDGAPAAEPAAAEAPEGKPAAGSKTQTAG